jgi:hypothetical protein
VDDHLAVRQLIRHKLIPIDLTRVAHNRLVRFLLLHKHRAVQCGRGRGCGRRDSLWRCGRRSHFWWCGLFSGCGRRWCCRRAWRRASPLPVGEDVPHDFFSAAGIQNMVVGASTARVQKSDTRRVTVSSMVEGMSSVTHLSSQTR